MPRVKHHQLNWVIVLTLIAGCKFGHALLILSDWVEA